MRQTSHDWLSVLKTATALALLSPCTSALAADLFWNVTNGSYANGTNWKADTLAEAIPESPQHAGDGTP